MKLLEIIEIFQAMPSGGIITDENRYDQRFMELAADHSRSVAIQQLWKANKRINPSWLQSYFPIWRETMQDDACVTKFYCPGVITLDGRGNGFNYIGSEKGNRNFRYANTRGDLANIYQHRYAKPDHDNPVAYYEEELLEIHGPVTARNIRLDALFSHPTKIPTFNKVHDEYPASLEVVDLMKDIIFKSETSVIITRPIDTRSDSKDTAMTVNNEQ